MLDHTVIMSGNFELMLDGVLAGWSRMGTNNVIKIFIKASCDVDDTS